MWILKELLYTVLFYIKLVAVSLVWLFILIGIDAESAGFNKTSFPRWPIAKGFFLEAWRNNFQYNVYNIITLALINPFMYDFSVRTFKSHFDSLLSDMNSQNAAKACISAAVTAAIVSWWSLITLLGLIVMFHDLIYLFYR